MFPSPGIIVVRHLIDVLMDIFDVQILAQTLVNGADSFSLLAIPFFVLAGEIMNAGGLSQRIVGLANETGRPQARRSGLRGRAGSDDHGKPVRFWWLLIPQLSRRCWCR